jgi:hypothetical protein
MDLLSNLLGERRE